MFIEILKIRAENLHSTAFEITSQLPSPEKRDCQFLPGFLFFDFAYVECYYLILDQYHVNAETIVHTRSLCFIELCSDQVFKY